LIQKIFSSLNFEVKERVETLEELIVSSGATQSDGTNKILQQKSSVGSVKRDSMVAGIYQ
jgi:hypothetical protein